MLDIQLLRNDLDGTAARLAVRGKTHLKKTQAGQSVPTPLVGTEFLCALCVLCG
jgi:hypothetical protein